MTLWFQGRWHERRRLLKGGETKQTMITLWSTVWRNRRSNSKHAGRWDRHTRSECLACEVRLSGVTFINYGRRKRAGKFGEFGKNPGQNPGQRAISLKEIAL